MVETKILEQRFLNGEAFLGLRVVTLSDKLKQLAIAVTVDSHIRGRAFREEIDADRTALLYRTDV